MAAAAVFPTMIRPPPSSPAPTPLTTVPTTASRLLLLGDLTVADQATTMTHRGPQHTDRRFLTVVPATSLAGQVRQRRAVAVICLNRAEPNCVRAALVSDGANIRTEPG